jgi:hypothetical protein
MDLRETENNDIDWVKLTQDGVKLRGPVNSETNLGVP